MKNARNGPRKVTSGIWAVTHSSAGEGSATRTIALSCGLNAADPLLYLVNMSHLICAATVRERGVTPPTRTQSCASP